MNFKNDYLIIYKNIPNGLYDFEDIDNSIHLSKILDFDNKSNSWTEYDHYIAYETFFGQLKEEHEYILKLTREKLIETLKQDVPNTWEIYLKIIDYYIK